METVEAGALRPADYVVSVSYHDELTRYPQGWRIDRRVLVPHGSEMGRPTVLGLGVLPQTQSGIQALARR
jgi:hypothetical protein